MSNSGTDSGVGGKCVPINFVNLPTQITVSNSPFPVQVNLGKVESANPCGAAGTQITLAFVPTDGASYSPSHLTISQSGGNWIADGQVTVLAVPSGGSLTISAQNPTVPNSKISSTAITVSS